MSTQPEATSDQFIEAALDSAKRAEEHLAAHPGIADAGLCPALVLGNTARVEQLLKDDPKLATAKLGPRNWQPLLYVCFSRLSSAKSAATAEVLLRHGADPNAFYIHKDYPNSPLSCLYGAAGLNNNTALATVLIDAGARMNDGESLYHSTEHPDLACFRLLLQRGASTANTNALKHILDWENLEGVELLLAAGADPNELNHRGETALHWAVWRARTPKIIEALLNAGAQIDAKRPDGRTAYAIAVLSGQTETAALLASRGADTNLPALDRFIGACATLGPTLPEEYHKFLPEFAANHRTQAVRVLLAAGVPVDARGEHGGTALHWACWKGYADLVEILLKNGASLTIEDHAFHAPPSGWLEHGRENCGEGNYAKVADLLREHPEQT